MATNEYKIMPSGITGSADTAADLFEDYNVDMTPQEGESFGIDLIDQPEDSADIVDLGWFKYIEVSQSQFEEQIETLAACFGVVITKLEYVHEEI